MAYRENCLFVNDEDTNHCESNRFSAKSTQKDVHLRRTTHVDQMLVSFCTLVTCDWLIDWLIRVRLPGRSTFICRPGQVTGTARGPTSNFAPTWQKVVPLFSALLNSKLQYLSDIRKIGFFGGLTQKDIWRQRSSARTCNGWGSLLHFFQRGFPESWGRMRRKKRGGGERKLVRRGNYKCQFILRFVVPLINVFTCVYVTAWRVMRANKMMMMMIMTEREKPKIVKRQWDVEGTSGGNGEIAQNLAK